MKYWLKLFVLLAFSGLYLACKSKPQQDPAPAQPVQTEKSTVIYVVRHAEKSNNHPTNPDLSTTGHLRAQALKDSLAAVPVKTIYVTTYKRTQQTGQPTAAAKNLTPLIYDALETSNLAATVRQKNLNQTVLIVGHSNTVLEIIEAFGVARPVATIGESDYNYLFRVTLPEKGAAKAEVLYYGH